jgi:hypothetical protein
MHLFLSLIILLPLWTSQLVYSIASPFQAGTQFHKLVARQDTTPVADPCDCACGPIATAVEACVQSNTTDIFCSCPAFLESSALCASCTASGSINSTYSADFPPFSLEVVTAFCTCKEPCAAAAPAFFVCPGGVKGVNCTCDILATSYSEECSCCLKKADPWLEGIVALFSSQCIDYLSGGNGETFLFKH